MMRLALVCALLLWASDALAQDGAASMFLKRMDENRDGVLSRGEWSGSGATFLQYDLDRDGYLDEEELNIGRRKKGRSFEDVDEEPAVDILEVAIGSFSPPPPPSVLRTCNACHNSDRILAARKDAYGWERTVKRMQAKNGGSFGDREADQAIAYMNRQRKRLAEDAMGYGTTQPIAEWGVLFDRVEPHRYDRDGNGKLSANELVRLVMDAADLDDDGSLGRAEYSLMPVAADRAAAFEKADRNHDDRISSSELGLPSPLLKVADLDKDGALSVEELPRARRGPYLQLLLDSAEQVLKVLDRNRDGRLVEKELRGGEEFVRRFDENRDNGLDASELQAAITRTRAQGMDSAFDDFLTRYDLNRDGAVKREEFPGTLRVFRRLDINGDGEVNAKDAEARVKRPDLDSYEARRWRR